MLKALLVTTVLAIPCIAHGQEVAADFTPVFDENPLEAGVPPEGNVGFTPDYRSPPSWTRDIVVVGVRRELRREQEWEDRTRRVETTVQKEVGYAIVENLYPIWRGANGMRLDIRDVDIIDHAGRNLTPESGDDTIRLEIPFPCDECAS